MAGNTELHCINCWWTTKEGGLTNCRRCGMPLYLPDGRRIPDIISRAEYQMARYGDPTQNPSQTISVLEARALMSRASTVRDWVFWLRLFSFLSWAVAIVSLLLLPANVNILVANGRTGQLIPQSVDVRGMTALLAVIATIWTGLCIWFLRSFGFRVILLLLTVLQVAGLIYLAANPAVAPQYASHQYLLVGGVFANLIWGLLLLASLLSERQRA